MRIYDIKNLFSVLFSVSKSTFIGQTRIHDTFCIVQANPPLKDVSSYQSHCVYVDEGTRREVG